MKKEAEKKTEEKTNKRNIEKKEIKEEEKEIKIIEKKEEADSEELEEKIEEVIQEREILNLFQPVVMRNAPVLKTIPVRQQKLEEDIAFTQTAPKTALQENRQVNYNPTIEQAEDNRNYSSYVSNPTLITRHEGRRAELINPFRERNLIQDDTRPRAVETEAFSTKRRLPFERNEERKYKEVKI